MKYWPIVFVAALGCAPEGPEARPRGAEAQGARTSVVHHTPSATSGPVAAASPESICFGAHAQERLQRLADCMGIAVGVVAAEPKAGEDVAAFLSRALKARGPGQAAYQARCDWLGTQDLSGVTVSNRGTSWDHFDDGSAAAHSSLVLSCVERGLSARTSVELRMP